jgi:hypothetical protein
MACLFMELRENMSTDWEDTGFPVLVLFLSRWFCILGKVGPIFGPHLFHPHQNEEIVSLRFLPILAVCILSLMIQKKKFISLPAGGF